MAVETEKLEKVAALFPDVFMANKPQFFGKLMKQYGDNPDNYEVPQGAMMPQPIEGQTEALTAPINPLPALSGV